MERAGVARSVAMKMVGHRSEAIYGRYAITDDAMLKEGGVKLAKLHAAEQGFSKAVPKRDVAIDASKGRDFLVGFSRVPRWRNGRRSGLKIHRGQPHAGSSPALGTKIIPTDACLLPLIHLRSAAKFPPASAAPSASFRPIEPNCGSLRPKRTSPRVQSGPR